MNWWPEIELVHPVGDWTYGYSYEPRKGWHMWAWNVEQREYRHLIYSAEIDKLSDQVFYMNDQRRKILELQARLS